MVLSTYIPLISGMAHRGAGRYRSHRVAGPAVSRVRGRFSHGRVDDLESLSRHGLHHLVVPHPPRPPLVAAFPSMLLALMRELQLNIGGLLICMLPPRWGGSLTPMPGLLSADAFRQPVYVAVLFSRSTLKVASLPRW